MPEVCRALGEEHLAGVHRVPRHQVEAAAHWSRAAPGVKPASDWPPALT